MSDSAVRVVVVDDDALVRAGLRLMLGGPSGVDVVGEAGDGAEGLEVIGRTRPDVVLMDIRMPQMDGLAATQQLLGRPDPPRVVVLTTFDADEYVLRALASGASGFLKDTAPAMIVEAIERVAAGEPMLSPSVTAQLIRRVVDASSATGADTGRARAAAARLASLSERKREVAVAVGQGKSNAEIAGDLFMSLATVKAHVSHIFVKLGVANRVQIAILRPRSWPRMTPGALTSGRAVGSVQRRVYAPDAAWPQPPVLEALLPRP